MATSMPDPQQLYNALTTAVLKCSERCLYQAAKWSAFLLYSPSSPLLPSQAELTYLSSRAAEALTSMPPMPVLATTLPQAYLHPISTTPSEATLEAAELPNFLLAKSYFDVREYDRSSAALANCRSVKSRFLHLYARYIAGEKRRDEESEMILGPLDSAATANRELQGISTSLQEIISTKNREGEVDGEEWGEEDGWLLYLYGVVLLKQKNTEEARGALVKSLCLYPYNWSAWLELGSTLGNLSDVFYSLPLRCKKRRVLIWPTAQLNSLPSSK